MHLFRFLTHISLFIFRASKLMSFGSTYLIMILALFFSGCGPSWNFEDFKNVESSKAEEVFDKDLKTCEIEKIKFSSIIQGREYGFRGENAPFLGCMRYRGWSPKKPLS